MALAAHALASLQGVKDYLGISGSTYDTLLEDFINRATDFVEQAAGKRRFVKPAADVTEYYDGKGSTRLVLKNWPIESGALTSISYNTGTYDTPVWTAFSVQSYILYASQGIVHNDGGWPLGHNNIKVVYRPGYEKTTPTLPYDLELVCIKLAAKLFDRRKSTNKLNEALGGASVTWAAYLDDEDKATIKSYSRVAIA